MSKFSQKHAQYAFSSKLKRQKCHKIWKKSNMQNRNLQKTSKFQLKQVQKQATRKSSKKTQLHKKTSPNSREKRKVGNTAFEMPWTTEQKIFIVKAYFRQKSIHAAQLQFKERFGCREFRVHSMI